MFGLLLLPHGYYGGTGVCHLTTVIQRRGLVPSDAGRDMLCEYRDDSE
jgi:hypothetical protein